MTMSLGIVGAGNFGAEFTELFMRHPDVGAVYVTDLAGDKAQALDERLGLAGVFPDLDTMLASPDVDAVAVFTQRWLHGPLAVAALRAGKHVYSAVPMAVTRDEIAQIITAVEETGLVYMMGETSHYNPAAVFARQKLAAGEFGRVFYSEGDYVHDMDLGFYRAYQRSGGAGWKRTASFPPMLYPTHSIGGILSVLPTYAVSVSCIGVPDQRGDGVFDRSVSLFDNDFSNASALFELADGGAMRTNEMRRVGYPAHIRESRFRFFGTEASFEQIARTSVWQDKQAVHDVSALLATHRATARDDPGRTHYESGYAAVHDPSTIPPALRQAANGHEGTHHFLVDDFVRSVVGGTLPAVNAWQAARYTLPGIVAHESALHGGVRLAIDDFGDAPWRVGELQRLEITA